MMCRVDPIEVDTTKPEANREFIIYDLGQTVEGVGDEAGYHFYGYAICYKVDIRFVLDNPAEKLFKARISEFGQIQVSVPAWDYNHLNERDAFESEANVKNFFIDAMDNSHDQFKKDRSNREFSHYHLNFSDQEDIKLSAKTIYPEATEDEWLPMEVIKADWVYESEDSEIEGTDYYAVWTVVRTDVKARKKGKTEELNKEVESEMARKLRGLGMKARKVKRTSPSKSK